MKRERADILDHGIYDFLKFISIDDLEAFLNHVVAVLVFYAFYDILIEL